MGWLKSGIKTNSKRLRLLISLAKEEFGKQSSLQMECILQFAAKMEQSV